MRCGAFHRVEGTLCLVRHGQAALSGSKTKAPGFAGGYLLLVIIIAPAAFAEFLAPNRLFVLLTRLALDSGDGFQFLRRVVPLASDRCTFIEIKLLGVIGPNQIFPGEELVCPEITFLSVHHPPMPFRRRRL